MMTIQRSILLLSLWTTVVLAAPVPATLRVGVSGSEPFVIAGSDSPKGISVEVWQLVAADAGWQYRLLPYPSVPDAMQALREGKIDVAIGPISITADRAEYAAFSQPYYHSNLAILSRSDPPNVWKRLKPFFSETFFFAVLGPLGILALVGTLVWLAERKSENSYFPRDALPGIGNGIWFAIVTMSTVGYGDMAPRTALGRVVTGAWIIISVIAATSLVAGIASTLTLSGLSADVIARADQLSGHPVAVLDGSPGVAFANSYGALVRTGHSLPELMSLLERRQVEAVIFDRPQLLYYLKEHNPPDVSLSPTPYNQQNYGFALPLGSTLDHDLDLQLLQLREAGTVLRIARSWLGEQAPGYCSRGAVRAPASNFSIRCSTSGRAAARSRLSAGSASSS